MFLYFTRNIKYTSHNILFNRPFTGASAYNQSSWLHVQVRGCYLTIVYRKMSSFYDARRKRKKITTYRSQSRGSFAPAVENPIPCCAFYYCSPTVRPYSARRLVSHRRNQFHMKISILRSRILDPYNSPINRTELVLRGEVILRGRKYLFLSIFFSLRNFAKFFTTDGYTMFQSNVK